MKIGRGISYAALAAGLLALPGAALAQSAASPFTSGTRYDAAGHVTGSIAPDPDGTGSLRYAAVRNTYDSGGRLTKVESGELSAWQSDAVAPAAWTGFTISRTVTSSYGTMSRKTRDSVGSLANRTITEYSYDAFGRPECTTTRMNRAVFTSLPASACTLSTEGALGPDRIDRNQYDAAGQLTVVQKAYGVTGTQQDYATYTYSGNGKRTSVKDANGNLATMTYDGFDRQSRWNFPSKTVTGQVSTSDFEAYGYDPNGNRTLVQKRDGQTLSYSYDPLDQVTLKHPSNGSDVYYGYDLRGLRLYSRFGSATGQGVTDTWDAAGRKTTSTIDMGTVTRALGYQYDADGNRTRLIYPDTGYVQFGYDGLDRMTTLIPNGGAVATTIAYDNKGQRSGITRANTTTTAYGYDGIGRLTSLTHDIVATTNDYVATFTYNPASQVLTRTVGATGNDTYAWSPAANYSKSYGSNGLNQYGTVAGVTYGYDLNGNLTSDGAKSYGYDIENRLTSVSGATTAAITYDPLGRIFQTGGGAAGTTTFLYDGDELIGRYDSSGAMLRRYAHGPNADEPLLWYEGADFTVPRYFHADWQGSIAAVTTSSGSKYVVNTYDDYGTPGTGNVGQFQYTGQVWIPEAGLFNYKARAYSPALGRFMQTDPVGYDDQANLYAYAANDPINKLDPSGRILVANTCSRLGATSCSGSYGVEIGNGPVRHSNSRINRASSDGQRHAFPAGVQVAEAGCVTNGGKCTDSGPITWNKVGAAVLSLGSMILPELLPEAAEEGAAASAGRWTLGEGKTAAKWAGQMERRGWTPGQIDEAVATGERAPAPNNINPGNGATRFVNSSTGRSVVIDNQTGQVIHVGGVGFKY